MSPYFETKSRTTVPAGGRADCEVGTEAASTDDNDETEAAAYPAPASPAIGRVAKRPPP